VLREQIVGEKEEGPHLAAVSYREILCQIGIEPCTLDLGNGESCPSHIPITKLLRTWVFPLQTEQHSQHSKPATGEMRDNLIVMNLWPSRCSRPISLMMFAVCFFGFGCRPSLDDLTIWKAEARSPDGHWVAVARTIQNGGFGTGALDTRVYLSQSNSSEPPREVLVFDCSGPVPRPYVLDNVANASVIDLAMRWTAPTHLDVAYNGRKATLSYQVHNWNGVDVSARDALSETTSNEP
jgi:hypothetical protein